MTEQEKLELVIIKQTILIGRLMARLATLVKGNSEYKEFWGDCTDTITQCQELMGFIDEPIPECTDVTQDLLTQLS